MPEAAKERNVVMPGGMAAGDLKSFINRIENLEKDKKAVMEDIKSVKLEAKNAGFNPKIIMEIVKLRAADPRQLEEREVLLDLYKRALGME